MQSLFLTWHDLRNYKSLDVIYSIVHIVNLPTFAAVCSKHYVCDLY